MITVDVWGVFCRYRLERDGHYEWSLVGITANENEAKAYCERRNAQAAALHVDDQWRVKWDSHWVYELLEPL